MQAQARRGAQEDIAALLAVLSSADDTGAEARGTSPSHLSALLSEAAGRHDLPADKIQRWVGFARGAMAEMGLLPAAGLCTDDDELPGDGADPVADATRKVMKGLWFMLMATEDSGDERPGTSPSSLLAILEEAMEEYDMSVRGLSTRLGFVQGVMAARGMITVDAERDRTRPFFHAAYAAKGGAVPPSVAVHAGTTGER